MSEKKKDMSWELPAGIRNAGLNNLTQALGSRSREIVERLNNDPTFTTAAGKVLTALYDDKASEMVRSTMENIKQLMGGRCFLPDEAEALLGLQYRETISFPKLTGRQIEQLERFLKSSCPVVGTVPAAETHILFPQPSTISGSTFGMKWVLENAMRKWRMDVQVFGYKSVLDRFYNRVRNPQWIMMFWGPQDQSAVPHGTDVEKLSAIGYEKPDLAIYTLALGYMKTRGVDVRPPCGLYNDGTSAMLLDELYTCRTVDAGLNVYTDRENKEPALIRQVPLR